MDNSKAKAIEISPEVIGLEQAASSPEWFEEAQELASRLNHLCEANGYALVLGASSIEDKEAPGFISVIGTASSCARLLQGLTISTVKMWNAAAEQEGSEA